MSYVVGYGQSYPVKVHHRGASIMPISVLHSVVGCVEGFDTWYKRTEANPNIIHGALVGGPDANDKFLDDRSNYEQTEPTLSGTAPLVGLFSKLCTLPEHLEGKPNTLFIQNSLIIGHQSGAQLNHSIAFQVHRLKRRSRRSLMQVPNQVRHHIQLIKHPHIHVTKLIT